VSYPCIWHVHCQDRSQVGCRPNRSQTEGGRDTVTLEGTVPTEAQKAAAERVAREKAVGYKIRNLLTIVKK
jgi:hypothetical protein